ncbi:F-actin-capping protein subunit beta, partial [Physocladia obscura]
MEDEKIEASLDLMRRLFPPSTSSNVARIATLLNDTTLEEELLAAVDQPLLPKVCPLSNRAYLACDYNRDERSYRSPWSNQYDPPLADATFPSTRLRKLEVAANEAFDVYRELYFEGGVSSVYLWDTDEQNVFAGAVLIKKASQEGTVDSGSWDSIHVVEVQEKGRTAHYKLTSTIILQLIHGTISNILDELNLSGNMTRQAEHDLPVEDLGSHVANIGRIVEDMELKMRNALHEIYFGKTKDIVNDLRSVQSLAEAKKQANIQA